MPCSFITTKEMQSVRDQSLSGLRKYNSTPARTTPGMRGESTRWDCPGVRPAKPRMHLVAPPNITRWRPPKARTRLTPAGVNSIGSIAAPSHGGCPGRTSTRDSRNCQRRQVSFAFGSPVEIVIVVYRKVRRKVFHDSNNVLQPIKHGRGAFCALPSRRTVAFSGRTLTAMPSGRRTAFLSPPPRFSLGHGTSWTAPSLSPFRL